MNPGWIILGIITVFIIIVGVIKVLQLRKANREWEARKHEAGAPNRNYMWNLIVEAFPEAREIEVFNPQDGLDLHEEPRLIGARVLLDGKNYYLRESNNKPDIANAVRWLKLKHDQKQLMHWVPKV